MLILRESSGSRSVSDCEEDSLEIVIEQLRLEGGHKRGGRIRVVECLRQTVRTDGQGKKTLFHQMFLFFGLYEG